MHFGYLTSEYPNSQTGNSGGIGTSIKNLADALVLAGEKVTVFVYGQKEDNEFISEKIKVVRIRNVKFKGLSWLLTRMKIQNIINKHVTSHGLQLVEAPDWTGITAFMKLKCPIIIKLHGSDTYFCHLDQRPVKRINYHFEKQALKNADSHISVSAYTAEMTNNLFGLNLKFEIISNGIPLPEKFLGNSQEDENIRRQVILYIGTLIRKKGVLELPLIFNKINKTNKEAELVLIGNDSVDITTGSPSTWELMKPLFDKEAYARVKYLGKKPHEEIYKYYYMASVCVFPSFAEAFPVSWLEAMACERAIVASDIGWANEVIENGVSGMLCNPENHKKYAEDVLRILSDTDLRNSLGKAAKERVHREFLSENIALKTLEFYRKTING